MEQIPVETAALDGLEEVGAGDRVGEIGDGAGELEDAIEGAAQTFPPAAVVCDESWRR